MVNSIRIISQALIILAATLVSLIAPAHATGSTEVGVTDNEIRIGTIVDLSGPIAFVGRQMSTGARIYTDAVNDGGGIHGRTIRLIVEDDGYQSPRAVQAARKLVTRDRVFCMFMVMGSTQANAVYPFLESRGIPMVAPMARARQLVIPPREYLFQATPTDTTSGKVAVEYFVEAMGMKDPVIGCLYQDDTPGHDWLRGISIAARHYGIDVLGLPYRPGAVDFSSQIARFKDAGIKHIFMFSMVREPALILREAQRQQYRATYIACHSSMSNTAIELAGGAVEYAHGLYGAGPLHTTDNPHPVFRQYVRHNEKYGPGDVDCSMIAGGYALALILVEGLKRAGPDLTREGLIAALETFDNFDSGLLAPVTWGPGRRSGTNATAIAKAEQGRWVLVTPPGEWVYSRIEEE